MRTKLLVFVVMTVFALGLFGVVERRTRPDLADEYES